MLANVTTTTYYGAGSLQVLSPHFVKDLKSPPSEAIGIPALTRERQLAAVLYQQQLGTLNSDDLRQTFASALGKNTCSEESYIIAIC